MKTIKDLELYGKRVIIRCDFNVPIQNGVITDDNRIKASLVTIKHALSKGGKVILMSHLGRIKSEEDKKTKSLKIVAERLEHLLRQDVLFIPETRNVEKKLAKLKNGQIALLENTRFEDYPKQLESKNNQELAKYWASLGDFFINDAFATSHRAHASNVGIATYLPSAIGFLVEKELQQLKKVEDPAHPYVVILGGAKVADKIPLLENLINKADYVLIGGGIANTFIKAKGHEVGKSLIDEDSIEFCKKLMAKSDKIIIPIDVKIAPEISKDVTGEIVNIDQIKPDMQCLDIGPLTLELFKKHLATAKTVVWNGTVGYAELVNFSFGTRELASYLKRLDAITIIGGGDTAAAVIKMGFTGGFSHISTGGGASIEMLEGKELIGIKVINR